MVPVVSIARDPWCPWFVLTYSELSLVLQGNLSNRGTSFLVLTPLSPELWWLNGSKIACWKWLDYLLCEIKAVCLKLNVETRWRKSQRCLLQKHPGCPRHHSSPECAAKLLLLTSLISSSCPQMPAFKIMKKIIKAFLIQLYCLSVPFHYQSQNMLFSTISHDRCAEFQLHSNPLQLWNSIILYFGANRPFETQVKNLITVDKFCFPLWGYLPWGLKCSQQTHKWIFSIITS